MDSIAVTTPTLADSVQYWTAASMKEQALFFENANMYLDFYIPVFLIIWVPISALIYCACVYFKNALNKPKNRKIIQNLSHK